LKLAVFLAGEEKSYLSSEVEQAIRKKYEIGF
jgi:hypothetical protein